MKTLILIWTAILVCKSLQSQTVENIQVETNGDQILIHYRIGASAPDQLFHVTLTCSMDGITRFEPASTRGDVGPNILGGKSNYTIMWDVFEDLEEVSQAEFFVRIDLDRDESVNEDRHMFIGFNGSTYSPYGLGAGSLGKYGFFGHIRSGTNNDEFQTDIWITLTAGFTIQTLSKGVYIINAYAGPGTSVEYYKELETGDAWTSPMLALEGGIIHRIGRITLTTGMAFVSGYGLHFVYGVGFLF